MDGLADLNQLEIARRDRSQPIGYLPKRMIDIVLALSGIAGLGSTTSASIA
jgi:hypothetical protein